MSNTDNVIIIDYGVGNLLSVKRALEYCGCNGVIITSDPEVILNSSKVILPGVGAFTDGMRLLRETGLDTVIKTVVERQIHLLGICLGMQLLFDSSEEFGSSEGLGIIPGKVIKIPIENNHESIKLPHIGWSELSHPDSKTKWDGTIMADIQPEEFVYFVHSFMAATENPEDVLAYGNYGTLKITAAIGRGNVWGCQFHPEKSGDVGIKILKRFVNL